jgi:ATP-dependent exoDNAse (exonuclease V) alpha subunit
VYQSELADRLKQSGYEIELGKNGAPEIRGYTREYLEANSPRRKQITEHLSLSGYEGAGAAQVAAHRTRESKLTITPEEMRLRHQEVAMAFGNQPDKVVQQSRERGLQLQQSEQVSKHAQMAVTYARDKNFEREAVADERDLMRDALKRSLGTATLDAIQSEFSKRQNGREFIEVASQRTGSPQRSWTTEEMLDLEASNLRTVQQGRDQYHSIARDETIRAISEHGLDAHLTAKQRDAAFEILRSPDQITGLQGSAGSGKTTSLSLIRTAAEHDGYEIHGLAPTTRAARQLETAGINSTTLQHLLTQGKQSGEGSRHLYVLDESSLTSTKQMHEFFNRLQPHDRVLVVGDVRQHQGVEAGRPFQQMQEGGLRTARLDDIVRQQNEVLKQAVDQLSQGKVGHAVTGLRLDGRVHEIADAEARTKAIARDYVSAPNSTLVISPDNNSRERINRAIHQELQVQGTVEQSGYEMRVLSPRHDLTGAERRWASRYESGDVIRYSRGSEALGIQSGEYGVVRDIDGERNQLTVTLRDGDSVTYDPRRLQGVNVYRETNSEFAVGDRVQFTSPYRDLKIPNREMGVIEEIDREQNLSIRLDSGRSVRFNLAEHPHIDYGYAVTSYSGQGQTADRVLVHVDTTQSEHLVNDRFAYVALSRGRYDAEIYTDSSIDLARTLSRHTSKSSAIESHERFQAHQHEEEFGHKADDSLKHEAATEESRGEEGHAHGHDAGL